MALRLGAIVKALGGSLFGDPERQILALAPLDSATIDDLSFLSQSRYGKLLSTTQAGCIVVSPDLQGAAVARGDCIVTDDPYYYFSRVSQLWKTAHFPAPAPSVHSSAVVDPLAVIDPTASIGPLCVIEAGAHVGAFTVLKSHVTVAENCRIGQRCLVHPGVVIGADGFGFALHGGKWEKIEQLGAVRIGDDVEIGANTCIDRGALQDTVIEDGVKLDNLIQIGHNVQIGEHTAMAGCAGVAGSAVIGAHCTVGGGAVILGHLTLADHVNVSAASVVTRSLLKAGHYTGMFPIDDNISWEKNAATIKQLHKLRERIRTLEGALEKLEKP